MRDLELSQVNLVQGQCVNLTMPNSQLDINIEFGHAVNPIAPGVLQASTKINVTTIKNDPVAPFQIEFELRSTFKAPADLSSTEAFDESARIVFPFVQANLSQFCALLGLPPIIIPMSAIPPAPAANN